MGQDDSALLITGIVGALLSFVLAMAGGLAPYWMESGGPMTARRERWMHRLNAFAGGILAGAGFTHLVPDVVVAAESLGLEKTPTPYIFILVGFLIPFTLENVPLGGLFRGLVGTGAVAGEEGVEEEGGDGEEDGLVDGSDRDRGTLTAEQAEELRELQERRAGARSVAWLLVTTLAVHSMLEGLGIGVQAELIASLGILAAVLAHKGFAAFALGMAFHGAHVPVQEAAKGVGLFAAMTPIGILTGLVMRVETQSPWVDVIAVGLSAGTFVYVAIEILQAECGPATPHTHHPHTPTPSSPSTANTPSTDSEPHDDTLPKFGVFLIGALVFIFLGYALVGL